jgi:hypothetical protein
MENYETKEKSNSFVFRGKKYEIEEKEINEIRKKSMVGAFFKLLELVGVDCTSYESVLNIPEDIKQSIPEALCKLEHLASKTNSVESFKSKMKHSLSQHFHNSNKKKNTKSKMDDKKMKKIRKY